MKKGKREEKQHSKREIDKRPFSYCILQFREKKMLFIY